MPKTDYYVFSLNILKPSFMKFVNVNNFNNLSKDYKVLIDSTNFIVHIFVCLSAMNELEPMISVINFKSRGPFRSKLISKIPN